MKKILFICQANVGRSQMAEAFYNFHTGTTAATSAGVEDFREKYHHHPTAEIVATMREKGIDISKQNIDFLEKNMLANADRVVVLCAKQLCPTFLLQSERVIFREVEDPHQLDPHAIRQIRDQIEEIVLEFITEFRHF